MGKQGFDKRTALANALNTSGVAKAAPAKKEAPPKAPAVEPGKGKGKRKNEPAPPEKTRKEIEEEQRQMMEENKRRREEFYSAEAAKKLQEGKSADTAVTFVEDQKTRKPKAINDISDYWKADLGMFPFSPDINVGALCEDIDEVDPQERLEYLEMLNEQLGQLLRLRFNVFWSQIIYDASVRRCVDSYLRFSLRSYDSLGELNGIAGLDVVAEQEAEVTKSVSRRMLALLVRMSRPQETTNDFISDGKFAQVIYEHSIFDVPKLIDICTIYGDSNRIEVTKIVHSVFMRQPLYKDDFKSVVNHMLSGLEMCCGPLQSAGRNEPMHGSDLTVDDCLAFLPDILSCFTAIFCFFPEDCIKDVVESQLDVPSSAQADGDEGAEMAALPLADLMVLLHDAVTTMQDGFDATPTPALDMIIRLLSRLLGLVLGFRMAPRKGPSAFEELLDWLRAQAGRTVMLQDLGRHGLECTAMDWLASGMVDDAQLDYLEQICGPVLPAGERRRHRPAAKPLQCKSAPGQPGSCMNGAGASSSTSKPAGSTDASATDVAKVREVREVVGTQYGEGFVLQCLLHYGTSVPAVVGAILDGSLPPHIRALPEGLTLADAISTVSEQAATQHAQPKSGLSAEDKKHVLSQARRINEAGDEPDVEIDDVYNDDVDDSLPMPGNFRVGGAQDSDSEESGDEEAVDSDEPDRWGSSWSKGGGKGKGKGKGKYGPVQGQTYEARRKEQNKARFANHNRREGAMRKLQKGMT